MTTENKPTFETKPLTGSVFFQAEKTNPKHADWKGQYKHSDGVEYWANGFDRNANKNQPGLFISFQKKGTTYEKRSNLDKTNTAELSINPNKTADNHPELKGKANIEGSEFWISAWKRVAPKSGNKYLSFVLQDINSQTSQKQSSSTSQSSNSSNSSDGPNQANENWSQPPRDDAPTQALDIGVPLDFDDSPPF